MKKCSPFKINADATQAVGQLGKEEEKRISRAWTQLNKPNNRSIFCRFSETDIKPGDSKAVNIKLKLDK